jgi:hypothetical protein|tara:strand:- start:57 stop:659 length:603 start_codon:yes stop_codon:yes gene_type:complete
MKIPRIEFVYSSIYDERILDHFNKGKSEKIKIASWSKVSKYVKKVEGIWRKYDKKILEELSKKMKLKWSDEVIKCYIVTRSYPFSDPLTMPIYENDYDWFVDVLVHELIHQLFIQKSNHEKSRKSWEYFDRKYRDESLTTRIHIPLHALHKHIYLKFFSEERLKGDRLIMKRYKDYNRSWDIVDEVGSEKIVDEFVKRIR